ncbi:hypothetical protein [Amycolatopsis thermoflava]|uniref:hypothetical protein n=1 Tax=Amycolatopsis thermoflava TaxID=84480 RepID=UPI003F4A667C
MHDSKPAGGTADRTEAWRAAAFAVAAVLTVVVGFLGWLTATNHLGLVAYNFMLACMVIAWATAIGLLMVWLGASHRRRVEASIRKRITRSEEKMLREFAQLRKEMKAADEKRAVDRYLAAAELPRPRELRPVKN